MLSSPSFTVPSDANPVTDHPNSVHRNWVAVRYLLCHSANNTLRIRHLRQEYLARWRPYTSLA